MSRDNARPKSIPCAPLPSSNWWHWCVVLVLTVVVIMLAHHGYVTAATAAAIVDLVAVRVTSRLLRPAGPRTASA